MWTYWIIFGFCCHWAVAPYFEIPTENGTASNYPVIWKVAPALFPFINHHVKTNLLPVRETEEVQLILDTTTDTPTNEEQIFAPSVPLLEPTVEGLLAVVAIQKAIEHVPNLTESEVLNATVEATVILANITPIIVPNVVHGQDVVDAEKGFWEWLGKGKWLL